MARQPSAPLGPDRIVSARLSFDSDTIFGVRCCLFEKRLLPFDTAAPTILDADERADEETYEGIKRGGDVPRRNERYRPAAHVRREQRADRLELDRCHHRPERFGETFRTKPFLHVCFYLPVGFCYHYPSLSPFLSLSLPAVVRTSVDHVGSGRIQLDRIGTVAHAMLARGNSVAHLRQRTQCIFFS